MYSFISKSIKKQSGSIMPITALALVSIMGMAGLVVDSSHLFNSKTKLQNLLDAAALGSAKVLDDTGNQFTARQAANRIINSNLAQSSYSELNDLGLDSSDFVVQFSDTRNPFIANPAATKFVRIRLNQEVIELDTIFMKIMGVDELDLTGSAVAGPSPSLGTACNMVPSIICGDPNEAPDNEGMFGYEYGDSIPLVLGSTKNSEVGPGNYQLISLGGNGANVLRENFAGGYKGCLASGNDVETKPGANTGPVSQGVNTRFNIYSGPVSAEDYPPDLVTDAGASNYPDTYAEYQFDNMIRNYDEPVDGVAQRRVLTATFGNCEATVNGRGTVPILGFGCIFLTAPVDKSGKNKEPRLYGELIRECRSSGIPGPNSIDGPGVHTIQLYGDPDRWDS